MPITPYTLRQPGNVYERPSPGGKIESSQGRAKITVKTEKPPSAEAVAASKRRVGGMIGT